MRDRIMFGRSAPLAVAMAAAVMLSALGGAHAGETLQSKKDHAPKAPRFEEQPPPVHLIRCAATPGGSPCEPDPAMQRLNGRRQFEQPASPQDDAPDFAPAR